ncbi:MAG: TetR/AcrR family transcriptional regulator, partial [Spongiibacteraceae bacterium]
PNVTTVDIANELDISPGNLYYHFRGKEEIIRDLYAAFEIELEDILSAPLNSSLKPQDVWFYLYIVFEQISNHRYLYRNLNDLLQRYPNIRKKFGHLLNLKVKAVQAVTNELLHQEILDISEIQLRHLTDNVVVNLTFWLNYNALREQKIPSELMIHQGVFQLVSLVAPYLKPEYRYFYDECCALFDALAATA